MAEPIDYEAEGLLAGLEGDEREERVRLLDRLAAEGFEPAQIREAIEDGRIALLPLERALTGEPRYSQHEIAALTEVPITVLEAQRRALGLAVGSREAREHSEADLEAARRTKAFLDAGLDPTMMEGIARVMAMTMSQLAAAHREALRGLIEVEGAAEDELAAGLEQLGERLLPLVGPTLEYAYRRQLREQLRQVVAAGPGGEAGAGSGGAGEVAAVGFVDLVGFTRLGERVPPEELGGISGRLGELASEVATGPVRLIKLIGDGAMLSARDPAPLLEGILTLVEESEDLPQLRGGVALGRVVSRGGDLYGASVNLASRLTGVARPGSVLVTSEVRAALNGPFRFSAAGHKRLKGIGAVELFRCRRSEGGEPLGD